MKDNLMIHDFSLGYSTTMEEESEALATELLTYLFYRGAIKVIVDIIQRFFNMID